MIHSIRLFVLFFVFYEAKGNNDYCSLRCGPDEHTVCRRRNVQCGPGPQCSSNFRPIHLTDDDRRYILHLHNNLRNKVATGQEKRGNQPSASNMKALSYNRELESIAQCLTNTCNFAHDKCRRTAQWSWVGQNLGIRWTKGYVENVRSVITDVINSWYNEDKDFRSWGVSRYGFNARVGHYTQQVWANTDHIGCAITFFVNSDGWNTHLMACNYGPGGNYQGQAIYKQGSPASNCGGLPVNSRYRGLCGNDYL
ncbi:venom allergen 5-like [Diabrotica undecimpunctata]|uniref:venom allergen 5-like n=1 Tax=Diabrotica undecimpunctata TaxID=50387 RepID=UPI003B63DA71